MSYMPVRLQLRLGLAAANGGQVNPGGLTSFEHAVWQVVCLFYTLWPGWLWR